MKTILYTALALTLAGFLLAAEPQQQPAAETNQVGEFMRAKLLHSQGVLEGLSMEKYDLIARNSQSMSLLSQASNWQVLQTPEYRQRSTEFRRSVDALTEAARQRNLDGATLSFVQVTMKCVSCHKYVRSVRMAKLEPPGNQPAITELHLLREVAP
jgi:hypothetical protein